MTTIDTQQLDRLLIPENKKALIKALLKLAPEAELLRDDMLLTIHGIKINKPETQHEFNERVQSSVVSVPPAKRGRVNAG
jgi:hypothetical protein